MSEAGGYEGEATSDSDQTAEDPVHVQGQDGLAEVTGANDTVLVDFYADWCGPCKMLEPIVAGIARDTPAVVAKVDVDENQGLAGQYGVRGVPTMVLFSDGEPVERIVGVQQEEELADLVEHYHG
jgi:thioredoxin 1